eukprot:2551083-Ditylum_brightwellii.AAC.1
MLGAVLGLKVQTPRGKAEKQAYCGMPRAAMAIGFPTDTISLGVKDKVTVGEVGQHTMGEIQGNDFSGMDVEEGIANAEGCIVTICSKAVFT